MFNKLRRYLKSKLYRLGVLKKKTPLFVIKVSDRGFVSIDNKNQKTIFVKNIQPPIYFNLLKYWIFTPKRTILIKNINTSLPQKWYSSGKLINKSKDNISEMTLIKIEWMFTRR